MLPHFSLLPQYAKCPVKRLPDRCVAVWQQIYKNKNFQQNTSEAKGARFSKNKRRLFSNKMAFYYERAKSAYTFKIGNQPLWLAPLFRLFRIQSKPIPLIELIEQYCLGKIEESDYKNNIGPGTYDLAKNLGKDYSNNRIEIPFNCFCFFRIKKQVGIGYSGRSDFSRINTKCFSITPVYIF